MGIQQTTWKPVLMSTMLSISSVALELERTVNRSIAIWPPSCVASLVIGGYLVAPTAGRFSSTQTGQTSCRAAAIALAEAPPSLSALRNCPMGGMLEILV
mgnify:CR=1 FL=1